MFTEVQAFKEPSSRPPVRQPSLKECFEYTDLNWRLAQIPDHAAYRGAFFNMLDERASELGTETQRAYREFFQLYKFWPFKFYPIKDYLTRIVVLAQIHFGGPEIYRGIYNIQAAAYPAWKRTLVGRAVFGMLGNDFDRILSLFEKTYATNDFTNYASFSVTRDRPGHYVASFTNEYLYIEHAMMGALDGVAHMCDLRVALNAHLTSPFHGNIEITIL